MLRIDELGGTFADFSTFSESRFSKEGGKAKHNKIHVD